MKIKNTIKDFAIITGGFTFMLKTPGIVKIPGVLLMLGWW